MAALTSEAKANLVELVKIEFGGVSAMAREFGILRQTAQKVINGGGSRTLRVRLALRVQLRPSHLWPLRSQHVLLLDDYEYFKILKNCDLFQCDK